MNNAENADRGVFENRYKIDIKNYVLRYAVACEICEMNEATTFSPRF
jgi:hypothetical protein